MDFEFEKPDCNGSYTVNTIGKSFLVDYVDRYHLLPVTLRVTDQARGSATTFNFTYTSGGLVETIRKARGATLKLVYNNKQEIIGWTLLDTEYRLNQENDDTVFTGGA